MQAVETNQDINTDMGQRGASPLRLLRNRNFRLLWAGEAISLLGDQFYLIALPWLVLQLTGDALAVGAVLALAGVPRALFMLLGGVLTDRFSPRTVMLVSNLLRMILVSLLSVLVIGGLIHLWTLYLLALAFGVIDAFFFPAQSAIVPRLVGKEQLQAANALIQGTMQVSLFAGPVLAGTLIAVLGNGQGGQDVAGVGLAFAIDALTFLASAVTLWLVRDGGPAGVPEEVRAADNLLPAIVAGLRVVWKDPALRAFFLLIAVSNFLVNGPINVGVPVLADIRYAGGAAAFGIIMSAFGAGSLTGTLLAGLLPRPPGRVMGIILGVIWSGLGLGVLALGLISTTLLAAVTSFAMGAANGYVVILFVTWLQRRTSEDMLGRMMSLLMLASVGLLPLSNILTGMLVGLNVQALFVTAGGLMILLVFLSMLNPAVRAMEEEPVVGILAEEKVAG